MKFALSWLKDYLQTEASCQQICATLTNIGLEVESINDQAAKLKQFSVGKIVAAKKHENSNKLSVCEVEVLNPQSKSTEILQIVCGAANARSGIKIAYAAIGSIIPANEMLIKKAKIAGIESNGMLCSAAELELGIDGDGIIEIDEKYEVGTNIADVYGINDVTIEINVTPNRGDCLGIYGIACDLAAAGLGILKKPQITNHSASIKFPLTVINQASDSCPYATFRYLKNVKNCESPKWLRDRLQAVGINSISAIVDITNYVMIALNRPMHAYDASKINGQINIRYANSEEKFTSLKGDEFILDNRTVVISDSNKIAGIAGIIGSNNSSCDLTTSKIILEAAYFTPQSIARSGQKFNILSDARYRFERGVDPYSAIAGIEMATQLISEICGGEISEIVTVNHPPAKRTISFNVDLIGKLIGHDIELAKAKKILHDLSFTIESQLNNTLEVTIPSHRHDITIAADLVEEVVRIYGYNNIAAKKLDFTNSIISDNKIDQARLALVESGMIETINWSFCDKNLAQHFSEINERLTLLNPISSQLNYMRPTPLCGLIESYKNNQLRGNQDLAIFEIGNSFTIDNKSNNITQHQVISGLRVGKNNQPNHYHDQRFYDIFDVKKDCFRIAEIFNLKTENLQISNEAPNYYHPQRCATLKLGKMIVGYFGEIHPKLLPIFDVKNRLNCFEIFVAALPNKGAKSRKAFIANDLPLVERDFAFIVERNQAVGDIIDVIKNCDKQLIKTVDIFDIYCDKNLGDDKKSVALKVILEPIIKTLSAEEIDATSQKIISAVCGNYQAILRDK